MKARLMVIGIVSGAVLAAAALALPTSAQVDSQKGIFGTLNVGQMVEVRDAPLGVIITTYEDPAYKGLMVGKIVEIGQDFVAVDSPDIVRNRCRRRGAHPVLLVEFV